jgi:hypothetical protein
MVAQLGQMPPYHWATPARCCTDRRPIGSKHGWKLLKMGVIFAWMDKYRALWVRFDRKAAQLMGAHCIVYALIHLRHLLAVEKSQSVRTISRLDTKTATSVA